jgi:hypothetical protein
MITSENIFQLIQDNPDKKISLTIFDGNRFIVEFLKGTQQSQVWVTVKEIADYHNIKSAAFRQSLAFFLRNCSPSPQPGRLSFRVVQVRKQPSVPRSYFIEMKGE